MAKERISGALWKRDFPISGSEDSYVTRREFTKFLGLTSLAFLVGTCAAAARKIVKRLAAERTPSVPVVAVEDVPVGGYKLFRYPTENDPCILLRRTDGSFAAFDQRCTHLSCPVFFNAARNELECPCHEGFFSVDDGRPVAGPPKRALARLEVSTRDAQVWVRRATESGGQSA